MYFLLDLCCKAVSSKALAAGAAAAAAAAAAGPASAAAAATPEASSPKAQQPPAAVPGRGGGSVTPAPHAADSAADTAAAPGPQPAATPVPVAPAAASGISPAAPSSSSSTAQKLQEAFNKQEPCKKRACTTAIDAFAAFQSAHFKHTRSGATGASSSSSSSQQKQPAAATTAAGGVAAAAAAAAAAAPPAAAEAQQQQPPVASSSTQHQATPQQPADQQQPQVPQQQQQQPKQPFWFYEDEAPCPPDILELGRSTWTLLHSMAAYYPEQPSLQQQASMAAFISALGDFYPCDECAGHLRKELAKHPPDVGSASALSGWACRLHNKVNVRLGKPEFDCSRVCERWRDGPRDDPDACGPAH